MVKWWARCLLQLSALHPLSRRQQAAGLTAAPVALGGEFPALGGEFEPGDVVELRDRVGRVLGRGLANYRSSDCVQLVGKSVADIGPTLGWRGCVALHAVAARGLAETAAWAIAGTTRWLGASTWSLRIAWKTSCWTDELLG